MGQGGAFDYYLAQQGFIIACVDGRGTGGRGSEFEKCTYLKIGDFESKDQVETALYMGSLPYVDKDNIGIWGWSYGGFNTLMSMSEGRPVFKAGVAVAPPTSWRYYDTIYTERYMRTPKENPDGYDVNPIVRAQNCMALCLSVMAWPMIMCIHKTHLNTPRPWCRLIKISANCITQIVTTVSSAETLATILCVRLHSTSSTR